MKQKTGFKFSYLFPLIFLIIFVAVTILLFWEKDCGISKSCFDDSFQSCRKAKVYLEENNNLFEYKITGSRGSNCIIKSTITKINPNSKKSVIDAFEGKSMTCTVPKSSTFQSENILQYCTGPLKEAIYELMIEKMYNILAENLGDIISQMQT